MGVIRGCNVGSDYNCSLTRDKIRENNHCVCMEVNYISAHGCILECYSLHDSEESQYLQAWHAQERKCRKIQASRAHGVKNFSFGKKKGGGKDALAWR